MQVEEGLLRTRLMNLIDNLRPTDHDDGLTKLEVIDGIVELMKPPDEAKTREERGRVYGDPRINGDALGLMWTGMINQWSQRVVLDRPIPGWLVMQMMVALKLNRLARSPSHADSDHDARVYLSLAREVHQSFE